MFGPQPMGGNGHPGNYLFSLLGAIMPGFQMAQARPGDYVFGEQNFQDVLNQLMEQAAGRAGPQPASEEVIMKLPRKRVTKEMLGPLLAFSLSAMGGQADSPSWKQKTILRRRIVRSAKRTTSLTDHSSNCPVATYSIPIASSNGSRGTEHVLFAGMRLCLSRIKALAIHSPPSIRPCNRQSAKRHRAEPTRSDRLLRLLRQRTRRHRLHRHRPARWQRMDSNREGRPSPARSRTMTSNCRSRI